MTKPSQSAKRVRLMCRMLAGSALAIALRAAAPAAISWTKPADKIFTDPPNPKGPPPQLMLPATDGWRGFIAHKGKPDPNDYAHARMFNEFAPPLSGIGPVSDGPEHPFRNNEVWRQTGLSSTYRVADLNNEAAKNLKPFAIEALKKQNALTLAGKNGETRQARCWETGVPVIHEAPQALYFIQTPKEIVMYQGGRIRHVWLNVPHTAKPVPSWYGESVGHYEGDTLVVDTIGQNTVTFVDGYRTPHTEQLHVVERFRVVDGGKALDVSFTADDPGLANKPWSGRRPRYRDAGRMNEDTCQAGNEDRFNLGMDPVPKATTPDF